jgi:hypothetical protein
MEERGATGATAGEPMMGEGQEGEMNQPEEAEKSTMVIGITHPKRST